MSAEDRQELIKIAKLLKGAMEKLQEIINKG